MTLAEWRAAVEGYAAAAKHRRREQAWVLSHLLIAAGCEPDKVTTAKLLGEKVSRGRAYLDEETRKARERKKILDGIRKDREKRGVHDPDESIPVSSKHLDAVAMDGCKATTETTR